MNSFLHFFKTLFPSWKFFDESTDTPVLLYKYTDEADWKLVFPVPAKHWYNVLWNPQGNLYLAYNSHMQQLMMDLAEFEEVPEKFSQHVSYKITHNFIKALHPTRPYQFKVSSREGDFLISPEINP